MTCLDFRNLDFGIGAIIGAIYMKYTGDNHFGTPGLPIQTAITELHHFRFSIHLFLSFL